MRLDSRHRLLAATDKSEWPDGIVVADDTMMQGGLLAMSRMGIRPGRDVLIASHANKGTSAFLGDEENIIRLEYDPAEVVEHLFEVLETLMDGKTPNNTVLYYSDVKAHLVQPNVILPHLMSDASTLPALVQSA